MKKIYIYALTTALIWGAAGCKKLSDFGDTNVDPATTTTPQISALLTNVENNISTYATTGTTAISGGQYAQYFSETQYSGTSLYNLPQNSFTGIYNGNLFDLQNIINLDQSKNQSTVAKILQQYIFWVVTDSWGDVPYSEALKGLDAISPKYDKQEDIYKGILANLTAAVGEFDGSAITGDIIYGGDVASWKRAANSLRLLVAIQLSKKVPAAGGYAATAFKAALADGAGVITSNSQNLQVEFPGGAFKSPWYVLYDGRQDYGETKTMSDILTGFSDARQTVYAGDNTAAGTTGTTTNGVPYGLERGKANDFIQSNSDWARVLRGDQRTADGVATIITAGEVFLARAEAANIGWTTEVAATVYAEGIRQSFLQWGLTMPASYLTQSGVALNGTDNYKKISTQRWIASYPDGHQGWNIWRKSGFPVLTPAPDAVPTSSGEIVRRFVYEPLEYSTNKANVNEAVGRVTGYSQDTPVWWDTH
jgi:hypothetical protein